MPQGYFGFNIHEAKCEFFLNMPKECLTHKVSSQLSLLDYL